MQTHSECPPQQRQTGDHQQEAVPKPEERVDLLVDHIETVPSHKERRGAGWTQRRRTCGTLEKTQLCGVIDSNTFDMAKMDSEA